MPFEQELLTHFLDLEDSILVLLKYLPGSPGLH